MTIEKCCGAVLYTLVNGEIHYVIVTNRNGKAGFPKGHAEAGETELETCLREIYEETKLDITIIPGFKQSEIRPVSSGKKIMKHIVFFAASYDGSEPVRQEEELTEISVLPYEKAMEKIGYRNQKEILKDAHAFILKHLGQ